MLDAGYLEPGWTGVFEVYTDYAFLVGQVRKVRCAKPARVVVYQTLEQQQADRARLEQTPDAPLPAGAVQLRTTVEVPEVGGQGAPINGGVLYVSVRNDSDAQGDGTVYLSMRAL